MFLQDHPILINLTPTLTSKMLAKVMHHLGIWKDDTFVIRRSPINKNTHITIMDSKQHFYFLGTLNNVLLALEDEINPKRVIIFARV